MDYRGLIPLFLDGIRDKRQIKRHTKILEDAIIFRQGWEEWGQEHGLDKFMKQYSSYLRGSIRSGLNETFRNGSYGFEEFNTDDDIKKINHRLKIVRNFFEFVATHTKGGEAMNKAQTESVSVTNQEDMPSHSESVGTDSDAGSTPSKQIKITIYPDKTLKKDIEDLADVYGLPVSKFILKVIQQEVNNCMEDLNAIRSIRAKRA